MSSLINTVHNKQNEFVSRSTLLVPVFPGILSLAVHDVRYNVETRAYSFILPKNLVPKTSDDCLDTADWLLAQNAAKQTEFDRWFDFMRNIGCRDDGTNVKPWKLFISDWSANVVLHRTRNTSASFVQEYHIHSTNYLLWTTELTEE